MPDQLFSYICPKCGRIQTINSKTSACNNCGNLITRPSKVQENMDAPRSIYCGKYIPAGFYRLVKSDTVVNGDYMQIGNHLVKITDANKINYEASSDDAGFGVFWRKIA